MEGRAVSCLVAGCTNTFKVKSTFTAHMSRKHRDFADSSISDCYRYTAPQSSSAPTDSVDSGPQVSEVGTETSMDEGDMDM